MHDRVHRPGLRHSSPRGAILAGSIFGRPSRSLVVFDSLIATESLFNFCAVSAIFLAAYARGPFRWGASGSLIGLAGLVRPLGILYLPLRPASGLAPPTAPVDDGRLACRDRSGSVGACGPVGTGPPARDFVSPRWET